MVENERETTRAELLRLTASGDLLDLAREMRDMGVESLLFCSPSGRIRQVVTDRQIAHLSASDSASVDAGESPSGAATAAPERARRDAAIPLPSAPARAEVGGSAVRS